MELLCFWYSYCSLLVVRLYNLAFVFAYKWGSTAALGLHLLVFISASFYLWIMLLPVLSGLHLLQLFWLFISGSCSSTRLSYFGFSRKSKHMSPSDIQEFEGFNYVSLMSPFSSSSLLSPSVSLLLFIPFLFCLWYLLCPHCFFPFFPAASYSVSTSDYIGLLL